jgi:hypothetical protein
MARMMRAMLDETGRCDVRLGTSLAGAAAEQGRVTSVSLSTGETVSADTYVDGTGDALLCAAVRCRMRQGQESRGEYGEPGAPDAANRRINGVTLIYRITPRDPAEVDPLPEGIPESCWWQSQFPGICMNHYPNGDRNVNMLPTMEGQEFLDRGYDAAHAECRRRVLAHWHHLQTTYDEFRQFRLCWIAPILGVRESWRVVGEYVLKQQDLLSGLTGQTHDDIICIADHAMDTHGHGTGRAGCGEVKEPYGVPFRCLVPRGFRNLLVACRAASFSSIAASSCRLTRTMMQLGQAAGTAAAIAGARGRDVCETPPAALRQALRDQHVQLEWPATPGLLDHLRNEDVP